MAIQNTPRTSQLRQRTDLQNLGQQADKFVSEIHDAIDKELDSPLKLYASFPTPNARLNFKSSVIESADESNKVASPVKKQLFNSLTNPWINFQDQTVSNAADFDIVFPASTVGFFRHVGFTLIGSGKIKALFSAEAATEGALSNAGALFVSGGLPLGYVTLECTNVLGYFKTAGSATNIIENAKIFRFGAGAGGGGGTSSNGTGAEVIDLRFRAEIQDSFSEIPSDETPVDISSNKTDASLHDVANELYRLSYDASKTVTGTGTSMSLSAAPSFTVKLGDVLVVGDEVREITALGNINSTGGGFTIASAFSVNPSGAVSCVSQAVYTKDLNGFDANGTGLAVSSQITDDVSTVMVNYEDSLTLGDVIPDWGSTPHVAYHVTADNAAWSDRKVRTTNLNGEVEAVFVPVPDSEFRIRFFANKTSGSGGVNLLGFKAFWHEQIAESLGEDYHVAFARPTDAVYQNVSHSVEGGKSRFTFTFSYGRGAFGGEASGSALDVYVNGQLVPRYESGVVDETQAYFKEISDSVIEMDTDYSASGLEFIFKVPRLILDSRESNSSRITDLEEAIDSSRQQRDVYNGAYSVSFDSNNMIISLKTLSGNDPSPNEPVLLMRKDFNENNLNAPIIIDSPLSLTITNGSTLGTVNGLFAAFTVYLCRGGAGVTQLGISRAPFDTSLRIAVTAEGGAGGANSMSTLYATTTTTNNSIHVLGIFSLTQTTAGVWQNVPVTYHGKNALTTLTNHCRYLVASQAVVTGNDIIWNNRQSDIFNMMNTSTGIITAPATGRYVIHAYARTAPVTPAAGNVFEIRLLSAGSTLLIPGTPDYAQSTTNREFTSKISGVFELNAGAQFLVRFLETLPAVNLATTAEFNYISITYIPNYTV